jgi:hypothetical protein
VVLAVAFGVGGRVPRSGFQLSRRFGFRRSRCGAGGGPLGEAPGTFGRLRLQQRLGLAQSRQPSDLAGQRRGQLIPTRVAEQPVLVLVGLGGLAEDLGDLALQPVQGAVGLVGGVAGQLGAIQGDHADLDHAGGSAQLQGLDQEPGQGLLVADAEPRDRDMVGELVGGQHPKGDVLLTAAFELPGGPHAQALFGEQVGQVGREQEGLVAVAAQEVVGHVPF